METAARPRRWFFKCGDCLSVMATAENLRCDVDGRAAIAPRCTCGGKLKFMGEIKRERLTVTEAHSACDGRCTNAPGPSCDCKCGGENHGTQRIVEVVRDLGPAPRLRTPNPARAEEFRAAKDRALLAFDARYPDLRLNIKEGRHVGHGLWEETRSFFHGSAVASKIKNHKNRIAALTALAAKYAPASATTEKGTD